MSKCTLTISADLASSGFFLSTYRYMLDQCQVRYNSSLIITTKRLLTTCLRVQARLAELLKAETKGVINWFLKRNKIKALTAQLNKAQQRLQSWVSSTTDFVRLQSSKA